MNVLYDDVHIMTHVIENDNAQYVREICYCCDMYTPIIVRMTAVNDGIYAIVGLRIAIIRV